MMGVALNSIVVIKMNISYEFENFIDVILFMEFSAPEKIKSQ